MNVCSAPRRLSMLARDAGLRLDRLYLTVHDDIPPGEAHWPR
ncbi:hypothetical protein [Kineosporia babensis]|nr:hypothetical protein [Kineosporia babensis]